MILLLPEDVEYLDPPSTEKRQNCFYFHCWAACRGSWTGRPGSQALSLAVSPRLQQLPRAPGTRSCTCPPRPGPRGCWSSRLAHQGLLGVHSLPGAHDSAERIMRLTGKALPVRPTPGPGPKERSPHPHRRPRPPPNPQPPPETQGARACGCQSRVTNARKKKSDKCDFFS